MIDNATGAPAISVIVPCYNVEAYIDRALQSLREQTFENFEIIAVDDGSTDGTGARLRWWAEREPRLRIHGQKNRGPYLARLSGIAQARGTWVTFMDADDELEPGHLAGLWGGTADDVDVVVTGVVAVGVDGMVHRYGPRLGRIGGEQAAIELLTGHHWNGLFSCWNKLYRHKVLLGAGLQRSRIDLGEDEIFNLRVFRSIRGKVNGVEGYSYRYIARSGSIMRSVSERHVDDFFDLWRERNEAASAVLSEKEALKAYWRREIVNVMDFAGVVFRSRSTPLMRRLDAGLEEMQFEPSLSHIRPFEVLRWIKWRLRMALGIRGYFPSWLR